MFRMIKSNLSRLIQTELEEMQSNPSADFKCLALESNPRDWQFAIRGPNGTEFEGGIYHGQIKIPEEYPDKPPILTLLTENGRFKTQTEINLFGGIGYFNKYSVRDALLELIELLPTYPDGALGSVEYDKEERRALAIKSREAAPIYGTDERQKLINEIHKYMLSKTPLVPSNEGGDIRVRSQNDRDKGKVANKHNPHNRTTQWRRGPLNRSWRRCNPIPPTISSAWGSRLPLLFQYPFGSLNFGLISL